MSAEEQPHLDGVDGYVNDRQAAANGSNGGTLPFERLIAETSGEMPGMAEVVDLPQRRQEHEPANSLEPGTEAAYDTVGLIVDEERFPSMDWDELYSRDFSQIDWLPGKLCERGQQVALVGSGKVGKSAVSLDLCYRCVTGKPFLGDEPREQMKVLYFDKENSPRDLVSRLKSLGATPDELRERFVYKLHPRFTGTLDASGSIAVYELLAIIETEKPDVVIFDTVSRFIGGKENDSDTWIQFYRQVHAPLKEMNITGIRLDHMGKDETKGARGNSAKSQDVDHVWEMTKVDETHTLNGLQEDVATLIAMTRTHTRTGIGPDSLSIVRRGVKLGDVWTPGGTRHEIADKNAVANAKQGIDSYVQALMTAGVPRGYGRDRLRKWAEENGVTIPTNNGTIDKITKAVGHAYNELDASR